MKPRRQIILTLSLLSLVFASTFLFHYYSQLYLAQQEVKGLTETFEHIELKKNATNSFQLDEDPTILPKYEALYQQNSDLIGWIEIEGTPINYPVMYTQKDGEYYLHRDFNREYEYSGLPFIDASCSVYPRSTNLILYGHNMKSTTMFSSLINYKDESYFREHPTIHFDTIYEEADYQILSVFYSQVYKKSDQVFKYYQFIDANTKAEFETTLAQIKELSIYDTKVQADFGDLFITLSTCSYHTENGRFVVVAKKIKEKVNEEMK